MSNTSAYAHTAFRNTETTMYRFSAWITESPPSAVAEMIPLKRGVRMINQVDAERAEEIRRLKEIELGRAQRLPHPPQVPEKAVVVAAEPGNVVAEVQRKRPCPHNRKRREQQHGRQVQEPSALCPLPSALFIWHAPASSPRARTREESARYLRAADQPRSARSASPRRMTRRARP